MNLNSSKSRKQKAVFLDRDGVINKRRDDYVKSIKEFVFLPNVVRSIKKLNKEGYLIIVITNQSVVNRGIITKNELDNIHFHMIHELKKKSCVIDKVYFCPHKPDENCQCRKPRLGMIKQAVEDFNIDISSSWMIGDSDSDIEAAKLARLQWVLVEKTIDLSYAVNVILHESK
jgi:D-glycero-D-manno-heptose 1,7-bisphosphate phosphatase